MSKPVAIQRFVDGKSGLPKTDQVVEEVAVALVYNGISHAVMMCSPSHLDDFALGFSLSEGILASSEQLYDLECIESANGWRVEMDIDGRAFSELKTRRRQLTGRSGCGLCGVDSLEQAIRPVKTVTPFQVAALAIETALEGIKSHQSDGQDTGAAHAAAWVDSTGSIQCVREDVGRHNALDKLIGACDGRFGAGFALITSRASYEMVHKACSAGIGALVAISAPTSLAVEMAKRANMNLVGFARPGRYQQYGVLDAES